MQEASNAQTDREWMMQINGNVGRLTDSVERLATIVEKLEEKVSEDINETDESTDEALKKLLADL
jgi:hypothetical protein